MIMPSKKLLKEQVIYAKENNLSMNELYHNAEEVMAYRGMELDGKPLPPEESEKDYGIFQNQRGCFVHSMLLNRQFKIDRLTDILVDVRKNGGDPNEYLSYALAESGLDPDEELSNLEIEQITSAVDRAGRW